MHQFRKSGEPYWHHVVGVAIKLIKLGFPLEYILASLLHDCPEDAGTSIGEISRKFGYQVAFLVDFMSRNELCGYFSYEEKVSIILEECPWAIFLRLADISHNMETPEYYNNAREKIKEAKMFIKIGEIIAIIKGEKILKQLKINAFPNGLFGFIKRLEDKLGKAQLLGQN
ncbi:HD domain-containing protein [bacterium]|nr:HD domain-containing protein [bacterium]